jgi:3-deoxy-7-phosphoheptulonate synthase
MLVVMHHDAKAEDVRKVKRAIEAMGFRAVAMPGAERTAIGVIGNQGPVDDSPVRGLRGVLEIIHVTRPYKLASRDFHPRDTTVRLGPGVTSTPGTPPCGSAPA